MNEQAGQARPYGPITAELPHEQAHVDEPEDPGPEVVISRPSPDAPLICVVYNPTAGSGLVRRRVSIEDVTARFLAAGFAVGTIATRFAGDGAAAARVGLKQVPHAVVAMGGDGTINEVVQSLARQAVPLGIIPAGTVNVLAQELGLPSDPMEAVDAIVRGVPRVIDLGIANGRYFTMMIGLGYDAQSTLAMIPILKQWTGPVAYMAAALQSFITHRAVRTVIRVGEGKKAKRLRRLVYMMVVSNTGLYAGGILKFTPDASLADGLLDCCVIRSKRWYQVLTHFALSLAGRLGQVNDVEIFQARSLSIRTSRPFPYQLDGDPVGTTPVKVVIAEGALRVLCLPTEPVATKAEGGML